MNGGIPAKLALSALLALFPVAILPGKIPSDIAVDESFCCSRFRFAMYLFMSPCSNLVAKLSRPLSHGWSAPSCSRRSPTGVPGRGVVVETRRALSATGAGAPVRTRVRPFPDSNSRDEEETSSDPCENGESAVAGESPVGDVIASRLGRDLSTSALRPITCGEG